MPPDSAFERLRNLGPGGAVGLDEAALPPEAFEVFQKSGAAFGKFVPLGEIGRGGTSVVHRAWQADLRREVALKVVTGLNPELRERFLREARVGARLSHPAVLPVFEAGEADGSLWLAMPLVKGRTLDECGLSAEEAAAAVAAAARGVHAAHEAGVIHRDLKPRNIMREDAGQVRVMDFGLALTGEDATRISVTGQVLGTPHYMAPEQAAGRPADARTDVYGLGATLYRLLAGRSPYDTTTLQDFLGAIARRDPAPPSRFAKFPSDLETIVLKALDRDPSRRYATAADLADDLERFTRGEPVLGRRAPAALRAWRWGKRRRSWIAVAAGIGLLGLAVRGQGSPPPAAAPIVRATGEPHPAVKDERQRWFDAAAETCEAADERRRMGFMPMAIEMYEAAQKKFPGFGRSWSGCGDCRMEIRDWKGAAADYTRAIELEPQKVEYLCNRGQAWLYAGELEAAQKDYEEVLRRNPQSPDGYVGRSRVRSLRGQTDLALEDCNVAVDLAPDNPWIRKARATLEYQMGLFGASIRDFDEAIRIGGLGPALLRERGRSRFKAGQLDAALFDLGKAIELDASLFDDCFPELVEILIALASGAPGAP